MRLLVASVVIYGALIAVGACGAASMSLTMQRAFQPYFWLLGPPANLVHGTQFLWPFAIGTIIVAVLLVGVARSRSTAMRAVCGVGFAIAWATFGFVAYAPGA
jgi:hypothetical protein